MEFTCDNNYYGEGLHAKLSSATPEELKAFVLMERIRPAPQSAWMMRSGEVTYVSETLQELGVYCASLTHDGSVLDLPEDTSDELHDAISGRALGHLLRTKAATSDEGGVATGFSVLDSPWLV